MRSTLGFWNPTGNLSFGLGIAVQIEGDALLVREWEVSARLRLVAGFDSPQGAERRTATEASA